MGKPNLRKKMLIVLVAALLTGWIGKVALSVPEEPSKLDAVRIYTTIRLDGDAIEIAWKEATEILLKEGGLTRFFFGI